MTKYSDSGIIAWSTKCSKYESDLGANVGKDCWNPNIRKNPFADKYLQKPRYAVAWRPKDSKDYIST